MNAMDKKATQTKNSHSPRVRKLLVMLPLALLAIILWADDPQSATAGVLLGGYGRSHSYFPSAGHGYYGTGSTYSWGSTRESTAAAAATSSYFGGGSAIGYDPTSSLRTINTNSQENVRLDYRRAVANYEYQVEMWKYNVHLAELRHQQQERAERARKEAEERARIEQQRRAAMHQVGDGSPGSAYFSNEIAVGPKGKEGAGKMQGTFIQRLRWALFG